ncbi:hypothetical protein [Halovibrio salipaludis]|uniref:hypothetical protein n=1 Tax=Halovibrio salipaludis TaxID=2032626 RepID=UPI00117A2F45|nr:hypothetical protein [Halovibrio salipaludis]
MLIIGSARGNVTAHKVTSAPVKTKHDEYLVVLGVFVTSVGGEVGRPFREALEPWMAEEQRTGKYSQRFPERPANLIAATKPEVFLRCSV